jgi:hypothetical protein
MEKFLKEYEECLKKLFYQKSENYKLFNLDPDIIAETLESKSDINYVQAMYSIITAPLFYESIVFFTFSANDPVYRADKNISKPELIKDLLEGNLNSMKIPLKEKQTFVTRVVNIYIDVLYRSFNDHNSKHKINYPSDITSKEAKKLGFTFEEFLNPNTTISEEGRPVGFSLRNVFNRGAQSNNLIQYQITNYSGTASSLSIPTSIDGIPVMKICSNAFSSSHELLRIYLKPRLQFIVENNQSTNLIYVYVDSSLIYKKNRKQDDYSPTGNILYAISSLNESRPLFYSSGPYFMSYRDSFNKYPVNQNNAMPFISSNFDFYRDELIYMVVYLSVLLTFEEFDSSLSVFIMLLIYWGHSVYLYFQQKRTVFDNKFFNIPEEVIALEKTRFSIRNIIRGFMTILFFLFLLF